MTRTHPSTAANARQSKGRPIPKAARERAIVSLLSSTTIAAAAADCGIHERTIRRWMREDDTFKTELADARRAIFEAGMNRVQALTGEAIGTLAALLAPSVSDHVRLGAARTIAEFGIYQRDAESILAKLDAIEAAQRATES